MSIPLHSPQSCRNPVVCHSLKIWSQFRKRYGLVSMSVYSPITANHLFPPSLQDNTFTCWLRNGVVNIKMLYKDAIFMSFDQVRQEFSLPAHHFFRHFLQVRHFIQNRFTQFPSPPPKSPLDSILETPPEVKGTVSRLYTIIFELEGSSMSIIKELGEGYGCRYN